MSAFSIAINESQWMLCLVQVTGLILLGWIIGRMTLRKFPDVSASIGVVVLAACAGLVVMTWAGVPRPFELTANSHEPTDVATDADSNLPSVSLANSDINQHASSPSWLDYVNSFVNFSTSSTVSTDITENKWQVFATDRFIILLLILTILGGLVGLFRVVHSSKTIWTLAKSSSQIDNQHIRFEVARIATQLPTAFRHQDISVYQFSGPGSPFVSWLTGSKIFVPETFLSWTKSEQSAGLAHEIGHLQRRDHYCRLITQLTFCLTWLHPLAWLLHRQTVLAQELAADQLAAQASENPSANCRGLSRLALRFDAECRHPSALGVSVSSSLIRRITMLKEITFHRLPCSRLVNRCITLSAFVACTWIACWSVEGQTATQEKKVDSQVAPASHTAPVKMFSLPTTQPWDTIGNQSGYMKIQPNRILNHPDLKAYRPMITGALDGALRAKENATPSFKEFGLGLEDIAQIQYGVLVSYHHDPKGRQSRASFGLSTAELTSVNQVDWPSLINAMDLSKIMMSGISQSDLKKMRAEWLKSAQMSNSNVFQTDGLLNTPITKWKHPSETKKALWEAVSGGVATVVYDIVQSVEVPESTPPEISKVSSVNEEEDELTQANNEMTVATETAAWGVDLSQDFKSCQVRFAAVPKANVSTNELLEKFEAIRDALDKSMTSNDDEFTKHFLKQMKKVKISMVKGKNLQGKTTKGYLLIEGECSTDFLKGGFTQTYAPQ